MLELKNISKNYDAGEFKQVALNNINLKFNSHEFVSILGPSGSGKTTLLNIIGGLDKYDSGDLIINGKSTKNFKDIDLDSYRNKMIGFIFQSYNLINHIDILSNVEMSMTLSGKSLSKRRQIALKLLDKVGLKNYYNKKPNQLSGGQMQRVAIARALANDPEIILADEPTGALDSKTSIKIMELIKEISKDKLVIMVTHNEELAKEYSDRIITMQDGNIIDDTNISSTMEELKVYKVKKTKMNFFTALYLSINNIRAKKGRTFLISFASSIGIIGISIVLALSNGFTKKIEKFERDTSDIMPIIISKDKQSNSSFKNEIKNEKYTNKKEVNVIEKSKNKYNNLNDEFIDYIKNIPDRDVSSISTSYNLNLNLIQKKGDEYYAIDLLKEDLTFYPVPFKNFNDKSISEIMTDYYDILSGRLPENYDEIIVEIDKDNTISKNLKKVLGFNKNNITFDEILNSNIKVAYNNDFYHKYGDYYIQKTIDKDLYEDENNLTLKVVGIIRAKKEKDDTTEYENSIYYTNELIENILDKNNESDIVNTQSDKDYNVFTGLKFETEEEKQNILEQLGKKSNPSLINIYPKNFNKKDNIINYIEKYNNKKNKKDKIEYIDQAKKITNISGKIMSGITSVLVAFSSISLIVSSIMIGIITYISVLERTKEIGILRSLGARKKDIKRVFNAETFIIGFMSGYLGIFISQILLILINIIIKNITNLDNVAIMDTKYSIMLILISISLTLIGGAIPSKIASNKDPIEALKVK